MALGIVDTIDDPSNPVSGTVKENETEQVYPWKDPNFPSTGLGKGAAVTYDIDYTVPSPVATNLQGYVPTTTEITTGVTGPLTVQLGETLIVKRGGAVKGNVNINNGNLFVEDTGTIEGDITVDQEGSFIVRKGGMVKGNVNINSGSAMKVVNKGNIKGNVVINQANRLIIGNAVDGGTIVGSLTVDKIRKVTITATSKINP